MDMRLFNKMATGHSTTSATVEDVCSFLKGRQVSLETVTNFKTQKIDGKVVNFMKNEEFKELGLCALDILSLKEYCQLVKSIESGSAMQTLPEKRKQRKQELLNTLRNENDNKSTRYLHVGPLKRKSAGRPKKKVRCVQFGLKRKAEDCNEPENIKSPLGDKNLISLSIDVSASYDFILKMVTEALFPNGINCVVGNAVDFRLELVNARNNVLIEELTSLENYITEKKIPGVPKLFLLCTPFEDNDDDSEIINSSLFLEENESHVFAPPSEEVVLTSEDTYNYGCQSYQAILVNKEEKGAVDIEESQETLGTLIQIQSEHSQVYEEIFTDLIDQVSTPTYNNTSDTTTETIPVATNQSVTDIANEVIKYVTDNNISDPVEILRKLQNDMVKGRALEVVDVSQSDGGETNFVLVDRHHILQTGFDEVNAITDITLCLEVQFYGEAAVDYGGPRKEFFKLILISIDEKYFKNGLRELLYADYETVGKILALSILQNGKIPTFIDYSVVQRVFSADPDNSLCVLKLRDGFEALGIYTICLQLPIFLHLFQNKPRPMTYRMITTMMRPDFSVEGSNNLYLEKTVYAAFLRYVREVASGRRQYISVGSILQFITGTDSEPNLGYAIQPVIEFPEVQLSFLPTANTCTNCLRLPRPTLATTLPKDSELFNIYDYAFSNSYYGLH